MYLYRFFLFLHILSFVSWMAALLYLPRLFVYHSMSSNYELSMTFNIMEKRLLNYISYPASIMTVLTGLLMINAQGWLFMKQGWFHAKITMVLALFFYQMWCHYTCHIFQCHKNIRGHLFYRWMNEVPTLLLIIVVFLVIFKPF